MRDPERPAQPSVFEGIATIRRAEPSRGMITLRGDLGSVPLQSSVSETIGLDVPRQGRCIVEDTRATLWMSPDELLLMVPADRVQAAIEHLNRSLQHQFALVTDVSHARSLFEITGPNARDVLAKLTPAEMSQQAMGEGVIRRTRLAQVAVALWMHGDAFELICFRSVSDYVLDVLSNAAAPGTEVRHLLPNRRHFS